MHQHTNRRLIAAFLVSFVVAAVTSRAADKQSTGESVPNDVKRAIASEMSELDRFTRSGVKSDADFVRPLAQKRYSIWLDAANGGLADGQFLIGVCQRDGLGTRTNATTAVQWFRKAAEQGHALAQYNLGLCYVADASGNRTRRSASILPSGPRTWTGRSVFRITAALAMRLVSSTGTLNGVTAFGAAVKTREASPGGKQAAGNGRTSSTFSGLSLSFLNPPRR